jgi:hypothetical protein
LFEKFRDFPHSTFLSIKQAPKIVRIEVPKIQVKYVPVVVKSKKGFMLDDYSTTTMTTPSQSISMARDSSTGLPGESNVIPTPSPDVPAELNISFQEQREERFLQDQRQRTRPSMIPDNRQQSHGRDEKDFWRTSFRDYSHNTHYGHDEKKRPPQADYSNYSPDPGIYSDTAASDRLYKNRHSNSVGLEYFTP